MPGEGKRICKKVVTDQDDDPKDGGEGGDDFAHWKRAKRLLFISYDYLYFYCTFNFGQLKLKLTLWLKDLVTLLLGQFSSIQKEREGLPQLRIMQSP